MEVLLALLGLLLVDRLIVWASGNRIPSTLSLLSGTLTSRPVEKEPEVIYEPVYHEEVRYEERPGP